mgnify:CR=1 FL=1
MVKTILGVLSLLVMSSCSTVVKENTAQPDIMETNKKNLGNLLALYPKPMTVVGAEVEGKVTGSWWDTRALSTMTGYWPA